MRLEGAECNMLNLLMVICSLSHPESCRDKTIQFAPLPGMMSVYICSSKAQMIMANPMDPVLKDGEFVAKHWCERAGVFARL